MVLAGVLTASVRGLMCFLAGGAGRLDHSEPRSSSNIRMHPGARTALTPRQPTARAEQPQRQPRAVPPTVPVAALERPSAAQGSLIYRSLT
jgi:hypothetical protein